MSKEHKKKKLRRGVTSRFVMPLAGILSAVSARLYDMGAIIRDPEQDIPSMAMAEDAPLIEVEESASAGAAKRTVRNAIIAVAAGLFVVLVVVFSIFFGGMPPYFTHPPITFVRNPAIARVPIYS
jgi:hypothetical protein